MLERIIDTLIDTWFVLGQFYMRRKDAHRFIAEKLGVELHPHLRTVVNERMYERGCSAVHWRGFKVFRGVNLKGLAPWKTRQKRRRHLRAV